MTGRRWGDDVDACPPAGDAVDRYSNADGPSDAACSAPRIARSMAASKSKESRAGVRAARTSRALWSGDGVDMVRKMW